MDVPEGQGGLLHGVTFTLKRAEGSLHGEGCLPDVRTALCTGRPSPINVQRALCTVKAVSQTYREPPARLRFARAPISIHILDPWSPDAPHGKFWCYFRQSQIQSRSDAPTVRFGAIFNHFGLRQICSFWTKWIIPTNALSSVFFRRHF